MVLLLFAICFGVFEITVKIQKDKSRDKVKGY